METKTILSLLDGTTDAYTLREELLKAGRSRAWEPFLHVHHVEPERIEEINLTPLEHLAIHIAFAILYPSNSANAKVSTFVKPYPGHFFDHTPLELDEETKAKVLSFGQRRPETKHAQLAHARSCIDMNEMRIAAAKRGRALKGREIMWKAEIAQTLKDKAIVECEHCGKPIKAIGGNMKQHQRSQKCLKNRVSSLSTPKSNPAPPPK